MSTVSVALGERSYDIQIQSGALAHLAASGVLTPFAEIAVLSNETVAPLYAEKLCEQLRDAGKRVLLFNAPEGEKSKSLEWTSRAYDALAEFQLSRRGLVVAVGNSSNSSGAPTTSHSTSSSESLNVWRN